MSPFVQCLLEKGIRGRTLSSLRRNTYGSVTDAFTLHPVVKEAYILSLTGLYRMKICLSRGTFCGFFVFFHCGLWYYRNTQYENFFHKGGTSMSIRDQLPIRQRARHHQGMGIYPLGKAQSRHSAHPRLRRAPRRYLHMISKFQAAGFVVYADDHIGHGKTAYDSGTMGDPHSGGYMTYLKDEKALHDIAVKDYPGLLYFVFGHSWGSMLGRAYAALYGDDLKGLMLCGVVSQFKGCEIELHDPAIKAAVAADPYQPVGDWFGKVFLDMTARIENPNGPSDWIACNPDIVADHAGDMFNGFDVTLELVWDLVELYGFIERREWAEMVPSSLPVYLISGDCDPCGNYGEGAVPCGEPARREREQGQRQGLQRLPPRDTQRA